MYQIQPLY